MRESIASTWLGKFGFEWVIPRLAQILNSDEGDFALEEASDALIKIGTETVIDEVEKIALNDPAFYYRTFRTGKPTASAVG